MSNRRGIKHRISVATSKQKEMNKRAIMLRHSFDEVKKIINSKNM